jgi:arylsulfatase A-like enzyme
MALPHILHILADDLGWRYVDWHRNDVNGTLTPNLSALLHSGIELDRHYR